MSLQRLLFRICCVIVFATFCLNLGNLVTTPEMESFEKGDLCYLELEDLIVYKKEAVIRGVVVNNPGSITSVKCRIFNDKREVIQERDAPVASDGSFTSTLKLSTSSEVPAVSVELPTSKGSIFEWALMAE